MPSRPAFGSSLNPWVGNYNKYWSQLPSHYKRTMSARPMHLSGRFSPHDWQEIQRRDIPVPGISSGAQGTGKVVTAEDASRNLEAAREAEELLRLQASQQAVSSEPIDLTTLAGSSPLANLSLDPFAFTPDTGVEVPTVFANKGGAVMPGLGFRPLGYAEAGLVENPVLTNPVSQNAPDTLEYQFLREVEKGENFALAFAQTYKNELMSMLQNNAFDRTQTAQIFAQMLEAGLLEGGPIGAGMDMPYPNEVVAPHLRALPANLAAAGAGMNELTPAPTSEGIPLRRITDRDLTNYNAFATTRTGEPSVNMLDNMGSMFDNSLTAAPTGERIFRRTEGQISDEDRRGLGRLAGQETAWGAGVGAGYMGEADLGFGPAVTQIEETVEPNLQNLQAGGHVGRGTMAGELGRRGDLSVRQAGETMFERMKRLRGYAGGGYASRGTVAGELPHHGDMSVREEGESMGELHKRHRDQDWYNRMGGGLGSFRRRMA